jgi:hypothetical protein
MPLQFHTVGIHSRAKVSPSCKPVDREAHRIKLVAELNADITKGFEHWINWIFECIPHSQFDAGSSLAQIGEFVALQSWGRSQLSEGFFAAGAAKSDISRKILNAMRG